MSTIKVTNIQNPSSGTDDIQIDPSGNVTIDPLYVDATNNRVGVGTTSPSYALDVKSGSGQFAFSNNGTNPRLGFLYNNTAENAEIHAYTLKFHTGGAGAFDSTERARIDSSGRLLVGTSSSLTNISSQSLFQLAKATATNTEQGFTSYFLFPGTIAARRPIVTFNRSRGTSLGVNTAVASGDFLGSITFNGAEGTNFLSAADITAQVDSGTISGTSMPGRLVFSTTANGSNSPTERLRIDSNGKAWIGRYVSTGFPTPTTGGLNIYANSGYAIRTFWDSGAATSTHYSIENNNGQVGSITTTGAATAYNTSSDYRLKENVVPLINAADRLKQLPVRRFNFIADPGKTVDGFIAHEAQAVVPECVTGTKDEVDTEGNPVYQGIDQSKLVPLLTAALQEALGRIETLEAEVQILKGGTN